MPAADILQLLRTNDLARFLNSHRIFLYTIVSLVSVSTVIINALKNYSNFYSVAIYLSKSSRSVLALANFGVLLALMCGHIVQRIFFGSLRPNEVERLYDRLWFFITESLLAFTIFRDEFDTPFALMFGFLLFVKSFHWLASDRIEWMDQRPYPGPPITFHLRMSILFLLLWATDCLMFLFAVEHTLSSGVGGMVLFASEYGILMASVMNTILKYLLSTYDLRRAGRRGGENAPPWENKSMWTFYIELATDFLKLTTYLIFFIIIITFYGLPLNILRDVYITARSFVTRLRALHRYQTATRNMDQRYPNATEEELSAMSDRTCIICREEMVSSGGQEASGPVEGPNTTPKKLPCGHIFHFHCLRSWLERQQSCPTCRRNVLDTVTPQLAGVAGQLQNPGGEQQRIPADQGNIPNVQVANNPLGFIGRLFGPPPGIPNPVPNRQLQQGQGQIAGQGAGIYINYQPQPQQPLPIPPYAGFPAPGGAWQPWPGVDEPNNLAIAPPAEGGASHGTPTTDRRDAMSQGPSQSSLTGTTSASSVSSQTQVPLTSEDRPSLTSREAAARAALNRLGHRPPGETGPSSVTSTLPDTPQVASTSTISQNAQTMSTSSHPPPQTTQTSNYIQAPKLIPLYGFLPQVSPHSFAPQSVGSHQPGYGNAFVSPIASTRPPNRATPRFGQNIPSTFQAFASQQNNSNATSRLPPTLTEEQLAGLDVLTRESIDERLRILEGVSGAVYRCIDDLMKLRSALPPLNSSNPTIASNSSSGQSAAPQTESDSKEVSTTVKEKMRAVPDEGLPPEARPLSDSSD
ncbi:hypothetical protein BDN70DRAFT_872509 [Pholiota conissans]|uniref:RING-type E3 ubiquitin transferase n=1 Tax=Pholiota conissans TaxID=109636 RepID=A0A9P5ZA90_9AGAR|nr:hypothetical protein BDN70DRAFT_872509 [Pholiota conissans]